MSTEDRLRAALSDRAVSARTSPDALSSVFDRVARHRRNTRLAAAASVVAVAAAGTAFAATLRSDTDALRPVTPPTVSPAPASPTPSATTSLVPLTPVFPEDAAVVLLADGRLVVASTTTGEVLDSFGKPTHPRTDRYSLDWSPDRRYVYYTSGDCRIVEFDLATRKTRQVADGYRPAAGPVGQVAAVGCQGGLVVTDTVSGRVSKYAPSAVDESEEAEGSFAVSVAWLDGTALVAARAFEEASAIALVDRTEERAWDEATYLDHRANWIVSDDRGTLYASLVNYGNGSRPPSTEFFKISNLDVERGANYGRAYLFTVSGDARQLAVDARGAVLYVDDRGLWRRDDGAPELILEGVVAVGA